MNFWWGLDAYLCQVPLRACLLHFEGGFCNVQEEHSEFSHYAMDLGGFREGHNVQSTGQGANLLQSCICLWGSWQ